MFFMRKKDKEIANRKEIDAIIRKCEVCRIAMSLDDRPYIVPVSFGYDGGAVYLHTAREGEKIKYFEKNNRICFEFEHNANIRRDAEKACKWSFSFETVVGFGTINEITDPEQKKYALNRIMAQYSETEWEFDDNAVASTRTWKINVDSITGKKSVR